MTMPADTAQGAPAEPIGRVALFNRGAVALRLVHALREHRQATGVALEIVAIHPPGERNALYVREADDAYELPTGAITDPDVLERALREAGVDAAWGLGPVVGMASAMCDRLGIRWLGATIGIDAAAGLDAVGASSGVAVSPVPSDGDRVLEAQVAVDHRDTVWVTGVRDVTLRSTSHLLILESDCPAMTAARFAEVTAAAERVARGVRLHGVATIRLAFDPTSAGVRLLGFEPWLTEGHDVTEVTTGLDLARLQLELALGVELAPTPPAPRGHAVAVAILTEQLGAAPAEHGGKVGLLRLPTGPGLRTDVGTAEGDTLPAGADVQVARIVARGRDRAESLVRLRQALLDLVVVVEGVATGKAFLLDLLDQPEVRSGTADVGWITRFAAQGGSDPERLADLALLVAAADAYDADLVADQTSFYAKARRGRPEATTDLSRPVELIHRGDLHSLLVSRRSATTYRMQAAAVTAEVEVERVGPFESRVRFGARRARVVSSLRGDTHLVEVDGVAHRLTRDDRGIIRSPGPGVVVMIPVAEGDEVAKGATVAVIESMKMTTAVVAPVAGRVRRLFVGANSQVPEGGPLVQLDTVTNLGSPAGSLLAATPVAEDGPLARWTRSLDVLQHTLLGYDVDTAEVRRADVALAEAAAGLADLHATEAGDQLLIEQFADLRAVLRARQDADPEDLLAHSAQEHFFAFLRSLDAATEAVPARFMDQLARALRHYGIEDLEPSAALRDALYWIFQSQQRVSAQMPVVIGALGRVLHAAPSTPHPGLRDVLDHLITATQQRYPVVADLARDVRLRRFDEPMIALARQSRYDEMDAHLAALVDTVDGPQHEAHMAELVACSEPLAPLLLARIPGAEPRLAQLALETITRRYYRLRRPEGFHSVTIGDCPAVRAIYRDPSEGVVEMLTTTCELSALSSALQRLPALLADVTPDAPCVVDLYAWSDEPELQESEVAARVAESLAEHPPPPTVRRIVVAVKRNGAHRGMGSIAHVTFRSTPDGFVEDAFLRGLHPLMAARLELSRLRSFDLRRLPAAEDVYLFHGTALENAKDERLFAFAEVRDLTPVLAEDGRIVALPTLERHLLEALAGIRQFQSGRPPEQRLLWNRVVLHVWPLFDLSLADANGLATRLAPATDGLGLELIDVRCRRPDPATGEPRERVLRLSSAAGAGFVVTEIDPPAMALGSLDEYTRKVVSARRRGTPYPYELIGLVTAPGAGGRPEITGGSFVEYDLDDEGRLVPVERPPGLNLAGIVVGVVANTTNRYPGGMRRVVLLGDPTRALGSLAEPECRRINAALDLAAELDIPLDWFALSSGARIAMDSGTENMDWIAAVLRRIIDFTQAGGEINVVVTGINVGAQPYWNAEATMLMHTKGILVMMPESAMVLTGKQALDYSGGVSAEDNFGIGGYERIMGPNGQAQYWAPDLGAAIGVLLAHHDHAYRAPGERFPRRAYTADPVDRDVRSSPHHLPDSEFATIGDVFSIEKNPDRKLPFDIRAVMRAAADQDHEPLERWPSMRDADAAVVWDAHLGGYPVLLLGFESRNLRRLGDVPADGPNQWTSGTLFPKSSKKVARAVNSASGNRPLVVIANLSGFDGSPDSMRSVQLEYGAEIGRAVVNFRGPIVFCVVSRYHGGAFVVFSGKLNDNMTVLAVEGSRASVIGGAPAAAVVFAGDVSARTRKDPRVAAVQEQSAAATGPERARLREQLTAVTAVVRSEKLGEVAAEFDRIHSVERARDVGSVDAIIPIARLRPLLIEAVERGMDRERERTAPPS